MKFRSIADQSLLKSQTTITHNNIVDNALNQETSRSQTQNAANILSRLDSLSRQNRTLLIKAVLNDDSESLKILLSKGVDPNFINEDGHTPLDIASVHDKKEIKKILLDHKANLSLFRSETDQLRDLLPDEKLLKGEFKITVSLNVGSPAISVIKSNSQGKQNFSKIFNPWSSTKPKDNTHYHVSIEEGRCLIFLKNEKENNQFDAIIQIESNGNISLKHANTPRHRITFSTPADFEMDCFAVVGQLVVESNAIKSTKSTTISQGSLLKLQANCIQLHGNLSFKNTELHAKDVFVNFGNVISDKIQLIAGAANIQGQLLISKQSDFEVHGAFTLKGQLASGHQTIIRAHSFFADRESAVIVQHGELKIHGEAFVKNSGSLIANTLYLDSGIMITNNHSALIKALTCFLHAPQVNQAGFLISGQKTTLSYVDWTLNIAHASLNVADLFSKLPTPTSINLRWYLLLAKTLSRGGSLLYKASQGEDIQTSELVTLVLDNIVPCVSQEEKAKLLVNILYQFYGMYESEDQFINKSIELIEILTRTLNVCTAGMFSEDQALWLQKAAEVIQYSGPTLRIAQTSITALQAWHIGDTDELEKAQMKLAAISEALVREALYKLEPYQLLGFDLPLPPRDIVQFILNQGLNSDLFLQSFVFGALHAAHKTGLLDKRTESDIHTTARLFFKTPHWAALCKKYQENKLTSLQVFDEVLSHLLLLGSNQKIRDFANDLLGEKLKSPDAELPSIVVYEETPISEEATLENAVPEPDSIPTATEEKALSQEEIDKINKDALEKAAQDIPEAPQHVLTIDVETMMEEALRASPKLEATRNIDPWLSAFGEIQRTLHGDFANHGYLGLFANALHNEGVTDVSGNLGSKAHLTTNTSFIAATSSVGLYGLDAHNRKVDGTILSQTLSETVSTHFKNFESGSISAQDAIYLTCIGIIDNFGGIRTLDKVVANATRIIHNHNTGNIIAKDDALLLCDSLAYNEGFITGNKVHFEGTAQSAVNSGFIVSLERVRLISQGLVHTTKDSVTASKRISYEGTHIEKEGANQAVLTKTSGYDSSTPESLTWKAHPEDAGGAVILKGKHQNIDSKAFSQVNIVDVTLNESTSQGTDPLFHIDPDFSGTLQVHAPGNQTITLSQLPTLASTATLILDAPDAKLSVSGEQHYDSTLHFIGQSFDYAKSKVHFSKFAAFDVDTIDGSGGKSSLTLAEGGLFQADDFQQQGNIEADGIIYWNVDNLNNVAQTEMFKQSFIHNHDNPVFDNHVATRVVEGSGTIHASGHSGHIKHFSQTGGTFTSGKDGNKVYFKDSTQMALLTQEGVAQPSIARQGQNWFIQPTFHNSKIGSSGQSTFIGSDEMVVGGLDTWGDEGNIVYASKGLVSSEQKVSYFIPKTYDVKKNALGQKSEKVIQPEVHGEMVARSTISSNGGQVSLISTEGAINLSNVTISAAQNVNLIARDEVTIDSTSTSHRESSKSRKRNGLHYKSESTSLSSEQVYSSFIFSGGTVVVRCSEFNLTAVRGVVGDVDVVAKKTTLKGKEQTFRKTTKSKSFAIHAPGEHLGSILNGHNAKAIFQSVMNSMGWERQELEGILSAEDISIIPGSLLKKAQNAWNLTAIVAFACHEYNESPADFVGAFTDKMGLTEIVDGKRAFNTKFTVNASKSKEVTEGSQMISTDLYVGGTFKVVGSELLLLDGAQVDANDLRIFLRNGIDATKAVDSLSHTDSSQSVNVGVNALNPEEVDVSASYTRSSEFKTQSRVARLHARNTAEIHVDDHIRGEILIDSEKGGSVSAPMMSFTTPQDVTQSKQTQAKASVSTDFSASADFTRTSTEQKTTSETLAGIHLQGGHVSTNQVHLDQGAKISCSQFKRLDAQEGLPTVTGTTSTDYKIEKGTCASLGFSLEGDTSAQAGLSYNKEGAIHKPTVLADNVGPDALPGINTVSGAETEALTPESIHLSGSLNKPKDGKVKIAADVDITFKGKHLLYHYGSKKVEESPKEKTTEAPERAPEKAPEKHDAQEKADSILKKVPFLDKASQKIDKLSKHPFLEHLRSVSRAIKAAKLAMDNEAFKDIDSPEKINLLLWDAANALTHVAFGTSSDKAHERNEKRRDSLKELKALWKNADSTLKTELLSTLVTLSSFDLSIKNILISASEMEKILNPNVTEKGSILSTDTGSTEPSDVWDQVLRNIANNALPKSLAVGASILGSELLDKQHKRRKIH